MSGVTTLQSARPLREQPLHERLADALLSGRGVWPAVPAVVALLFVAVIPFVILLSLGFSDVVVSRGEIVSQTPSLEHLARALADPLYWITFRRSMTLAVNTTLICMVLGFPVAYLFLVGGPWTRRIILILTIAPILTSGIVRTYAWIVILGGRGVVNSTLQQLGLIDAPLPLSAPGLGAGAALVFTLSYTTFVTPQLLGGGNYLNAATMVYEQVVYALDWNKGSVTAIILMATCLLGLAVITALTNLATGWTRGQRA